MPTSGADLICELVRHYVSTNLTLLDLGVHQAKFRFKLPEYEMDGIETDWRYAQDWLDVYYRNVFRQYPDELLPHMYGAVIIGSDLRDAVNAEQRRSIVRVACDCSPFVFALLSDVDVESVDYTYPQLQAIAGEHSDLGVFVKKGSL